MPRALILGGTGLIGRATARRLLAAGWEVDLTGRNPAHLPADVAAAGGRFMPADRDDSAQLLTALGGGADLLVDCICYTAADATRLLPLVRHAGSTVMISSKAVYVDDAGHHPNSATAPRFDGPIRETQDTMAPGDSDYMTREGYGANKIAAEQVLLGSDGPVTVLRPSKIHGAGALMPREWVFVKRVVVAARPGQRILNSADPDAPCALEISRTIARQLDHVWDEVLLDDGADQTLGRHPWDAPHPLVLDMTAAIDLGYTPVGDYATTVSDEVEWLVSAARGGDGAEILNGLDDAFFGPMLDYTAEDRYLATHPPARRG